MTYRKINWDEITPFMGKISDYELSRIYGVDKTTIRLKRYELGIDKFISIEWTQEMLDQLGKISDKNFSKLYNIDRRSVDRKRRELNILPFVERPIIDWTDEMINDLGKMSDYKFADKYEMNVATARKHRIKLNIEPFDDKPKHNFIDGIEYKFCNKCKQWLNIDNFYSSKDHWDGLTTHCNKCRKETSRKYYDDNPDKLKELKEYHRKYSNIWKKTKRPKIIKVSENIGKSIKNYLRGIYKKNRRTMVYVGCTMEELKQHLESQFDENMSWENYGDYWQIDHIIPVTSFDLTKEEDLMKCWNYKNLRPFPSDDNLKKSDFLPDGTRARDLVEKIGSKLFNSFFGESNE